MQFLHCDPPEHRNHSIQEVDISARASPPAGLNLKYSRSSNIRNVSCINVCNASSEDCDACVQTCMQHAVLHRMLCFRENMFIQQVLQLSLYHLRCFKVIFYDLLFTAIHFNMSSPPQKKKKTFKDYFLILPQFFRLLEGLQTHPAGSRASGEPAGSAVGLEKPRRRCGCQPVTSLFLNPRTFKKAIEHTQKNSRGSRSSVDFGVLFMPIVFSVLLCFFFFFFPVVMRVSTY